MNRAVSPCASPSRRERGKAETRVRLLAAARHHFVANGFDGTRPQDVAEEADVAVGTFYAHFVDKRGAFLAFTEQAAEELMGRMRASAGDAMDFELRLRRSLQALLAYSDANPGVLRAAFADAAVIAAGLPRRASLRERFAQNLSQGLRAGISTGMIHADIDPELAAQGIVGYVLEAVVHGLERGIGRDELVENVTRFIGRALLCTRQGDGNTGVVK